VTEQVERAQIMAELVKALQTFTVESDVFVEVFARAHGLGRTDMNAIMWISTGTRTGTPVTVGELAARLGLGAPATSALVDRLEAVGHVERTRDPNDRRRVTIEMQPQALELASAYFQPLGRTMADAVADMSDEDLRTTAEVVRKLMEAVVRTRSSAAATRPAP
jgi:DNA-binding MarR family transcriptional regulator